MAAEPGPVALSALLGGHGRSDRQTGLQDTGDDVFRDEAGAGEFAVPSAIAASIVDAGRRMDQHGWVPATAGNLSHRLDDGAIAITRSGCHKGFLTRDDVMVVDLQGVPRTQARPSAETLLHCQIYRHDPAVNAVLHGHSVAATVLSMRGTGEIGFSGYEVLKAFPGLRSHDVAITLPVFDNDQDIFRLAARIAPALADGMPAGYLIRGHGVYAWGPDMPTALARLEALEFLLACELERARLP